MPKNTFQKDAEIALKKAIQQDEWILLIGGTSKERERLSRVAFKSKECAESDSAIHIYFHNLSRPTELMLHDYDLIFRETKFKRYKFVLLDVAGCSSEEMNRKILGPESEEEFETPNVLLRNKPILNILVQERTLFIDNFCCKNKDYMDVVKKISAQLRMYKSEYPGFKLGQLIVGVESKKHIKKCGKQLPDFVEMFSDVDLANGKTDEKNSKNERLKKGGKTAYLPDKELKPLLKQILKEDKDHALTLSDLVEIAQKQIEVKYGLRKRKKDLRKVPYYSPSKLKSFFRELRKTGKLRKTN